jgi:hypothetical protein
LNLRTSSFGCDATRRIASSPLDRASRFLR